MSSIIRNNESIIKQLSFILNQFSSEEYAKPLDVLSGSSIGMHTRHILEFYTCFLNKISTSQVCYDSRERQLVYEVDVQSCIDKFEEINRQIKELDLTIPLSIKTNTSSSEEENDFVQSSIGRELLYTLDHAIHHMAILKIGVQMNFKHIEFPEGFGVAPSTIRHHKKCAQ